MGGKEAHLLGRLQPLSQLVERMAGGPACWAMFGGSDGHSIPGLDPRVERASPSPGEAAEAAVSPGRQSLRPLGVFLSCCPHRPGLAEVLTRRPWG